MASSSQDRPLAPREKLLVERLPEETLVYDLERDDVHCLAGLAASVFELCDGTRSCAEIAAVVSEHLAEPVDEAAVDDVLAALRERGLLVSGLTRRQVIRKGTLVGAGAVLISTIAVPTAVAAASGHCTEDNQCPPGQVCSSGRSICCSPVGGDCLITADCCGAHGQNPCVNDKCQAGT